MQTKIIENHIISGIIDFLVIIIIFFPFGVLNYFIKSNLIYMCILYSLLCTLIFCKDICGGKSFGKYKYKLKVISIKNVPATYFQLIIRNIILFFFLPVEMILIFVSPARSLGDMIIGTKLIIDNESEIKFYIKKKDIYVFILVFLLVLFLTLSIIIFLSSFEKIRAVLILFYG